MRAASIEQLGETPTIRKVPEPMRGDGEALFQVRAAPINPVDISIKRAATTAAARRCPMCRAARAWVW